VTWPVFLRTFLGAAVRRARSEVAQQQLQSEMRAAAAGSSAGSFDNAVAGGAAEKRGRGRPRVRDVTPKDAAEEVDNYQATECPVFTRGAEADQKALLLVRSVFISSLVHWPISSFVARARAAAAVTRPLALTAG
jgi:hypothetical protein